MNLKFHSIFMMRSFSNGTRLHGGAACSISQASGKKSAAALKKAGKGLFKPRALSADLAAITGKTKMAYTEVTKALWALLQLPEPNAIQSNRRQGNRDAASTYQYTRKLSRNRVFVSTIP